MHNMIQMITILTLVITYLGLV